jgi:branched-chain amino acid transport system permease protein
LVIGTATVESGAGGGAQMTRIGWALHMLSVGISKLGGQNGYMGPDGQGLPLYAGPFWILSVTVLVGIAAWRLKFSGWGRALRALREDEIAAAAVGVDPTRYKVTSFVIAAVGGGIAGGMMAQMRDGSYLVNPETYNFQASFDAITMVILGGSGSVSGAILGGIFVTVTVKAIEQLQNTSVAQLIRGPHHIGSFELLVDLNALRMIIYACVLIALMIRRPEGVLGERELFQKKVIKVPA